ncbi:cilia- and flagella-associated protein 251-like [Apis florea]|uniref:cilia- and flagella-associated protein 251-like n=1 Tax=Apis florea TaxID=7463 RepID=UPI0012FF3879|nr:cilia- and flagella-associated protein 251-like [Apis florea]
MTAVRISPNAKYIVTVGNEFHQKVHFWLWTYGKDKPDKTVEITEFDTNRIKEIAFNEYCSEEFVLIADYNVIFFKWEQEELKFYVPQISSKLRRYGTFNCSCFIPKTLRVLTATTNGYIIVWDTSGEKDKTKSYVAIKNKERKYIKSVKLEISSILVVLHKDGKIVTGSLNGRINFYDQDLKILYWCEHELLDGIRSISFDFSSSLLAPVDRISETDCAMIV